MIRGPIVLSSLWLLAGLSSCATAPTSEADTLSDVVQLTTGFSRAGEAYFSPDMKWIVFQAAPKGQEHYQMYLAELKWEGDRLVGANSPIQISPDNSRNTCGFFSPDGNSLIFASTAGKEKPDEPTGGYQRQGATYRWEFPTGMEVFRLDSWRSALAARTCDKVNFALHPITNNDVYDAECAYSPDGKWIVYTSMESGHPEIYVMRPDGGGKVRLTGPEAALPSGSVPDSLGGLATHLIYNGGPFFSPDGKRIVFRSDRKQKDLLQIYVGDLAFDSAGKITGLAAEHALTDDENVNWGPYWHPDNRHIIYATSKHGHANYELYLMRDDGSHKLRITFTPGADILPAFSPDANYLMWTSKRAAGNTTQIFAARFRMPKAG